MKSTSKLGRDGRFWGLLMIAPTILGLMILNIIPFFQTIYMSFSKDERWNHRSRSFGRRTVWIDAFFQYGRRG